MGCGASSPSPAPPEASEGKEEQQQRQQQQRQQLLNTAKDVGRAVITTVLENHDDEEDHQLDQLYDEGLDTSDAEGALLLWLDRLLGSTNPVDVQSLVVEGPGPVGQVLLKYSLVGAAVDLVQTGIRTLPFGEPVAAALGWMYTRGVKAAKISRNAKQLLRVVKSCDKQLRSMAGDPDQAKLLQPDAKEALKELARVIVAAGRLFSEYCQQGALMRLIKDQTERFELLEKRLHSNMTQVAFAVSLQKGQYSEDQGAALRAAVCAAAKLGPDGDVDAALKQLTLTEPEKLQKLLREHVAQKGTIVEKLIAEELSALSKRVDKLEADSAGHAADIADIKVTLEQLKQQGEESSKKVEGLAPFLQAWWNEQKTWRARMSVPSTKFLDTLMAWLRENEGEAVTTWDEVMFEEGLVKVQAEGAVAFLQLVVGRMDDDHDGTVSRSELHSLQVLAQELARREDVCHGPPNNLLEVLDVLFLGLDRKPALKAHAAEDAPATDSELALVTQVQAALKMKDVVSSYKLATLLDEYVEGSRQKLYTKVDKWLDEISQDAAGGNSAASRVLLLLAGAGMGKSVFSAVMHTKLAVRANKDRKLVVAHHFFKVGQVRASGKVAILCLAYQLAAVLPGMAAQLDKVIREHGDAGTLSMANTCEKYLVQPLLNLAEPGQPAMPGVLLLVDAMDEADGGSGEGWGPVAELMAREFLRLPPSVRVLLTGRPEVEEHFRCWTETSILPQQADNLADLRLVMRDRLRNRALLREGEDLEAAVEVMLDKSKGEFIYTKYAFDELAVKTSWTVAQLQAHLPKGLYGAFDLAFGRLKAALGREKPALLSLLCDSMLPVLVAAQEPLTVEQLAWLAGADVKDVDELLDYAVSLALRRAVGANGQRRVFPYHKSCIDWLISSNTAVHKTGHAKAGAACQAVAMALPAQAAAPTAGSQSEYALRHCVAHLCLAGDLARLEALVLYPGFWNCVKVSGLTGEVRRDLMVQGTSLLTQSTIIKNSLLNMLQSSLGQLGEACTWFLVLCDTFDVRLHEQAVCQVLGITAVDSLMASLDAHGLLEPLEVDPSCRFIVPYVKGIVRDILKSPTDAESRYPSLAPAIKAALDLRPDARKKFTLFVACNQMPRMYNAYLKGPSAFKGLQAITEAKEEVHMVLRWLQDSDELCSSEEVRRGLVDMLVLMRLARDVYDERTVQIACRRLADKIGDGEVCGVCRAVGALFYGHDCDDDEFDTSACLKEADAALILLSKATTPLGKLGLAIAQRAQGLMFRESYTLESSLSALRLGIVTLEPLCALCAAKNETAMLEHILMMSELATTLDYMGNAEEGIKIALAAVEEADQWFAESSKDHPIRAECLAALGHNLRGGRRPKEAADAHNEAYRIRAMNFGAKHPITAISLDQQALSMQDVVTAHLDLADTLSGQERDNALADAAGLIDKAELSFRISLEARIESLGPDHAMVAYTMCALAELYQLMAKRLGRVDKLASAMDMLERALEVRLTIFDAGHKRVKDVRDPLAELYKQTGQDDKAAKLQQAE